MTDERHARDRSVREDVELATGIGERYEFLLQLGAGQYAVSRLAIERTTGRRCVVKSLPLRDVADAKVIELFEREASVLSRLDHPRIPRFVELSRETTPRGTVLHLVQEYVEGQNLAEAIAQGARFTEADARRIALELLAIVEYLHGHEPPLIHRDIKPGNIILAPGGEVWLVDFGGVRDKMMIDAAGDAQGFTIVGTYGYMPYEQFEGRAVPASDLYAIGVTLIFVLSHKEPIDLERRGMKLDFRASVNVSPALERVIGKLAEPEIEQRYRSAAEVRRDLERGTRPPARRGLRLSLAGVAVLALGLWTASVVVNRTSEPRPNPGEFSPAAVSRPQSRPAQPASRIADLPRHDEEPLQELPVPASPPSVRGRVQYDGRPISDFTSVTPQFWLRNETLGTVATASALYRDGAFTLHGLGPGKYGVNLRFDAVLGNRQGYPGDFYAWRVFEVPEREVAELTVDALRLIHLIAPQDNNMVLEGWGEACEGKPSLRGPVVFAWEPVDRDVTYHWSVSHVTCPYRDHRVVASGATEGSEIRVALEPTRPGEFYQFDLHARRGDRGVGMLMTYGSFGHGWDYRFTVRRR